MTTQRQCGDCQLCCKLLPTEEIKKPAAERCPHQKHGVGCAIYARRPFSCAAWNCRWLLNDDTGDLPRPDRAHYVLDVMPDFIVATDPETGKPTTISVVQVWVDPAYPLAHRAPSFRRWLDRQHKPAVIRYNSNDGFVLVPPSMTSSATWLEIETEPKPRQFMLDKAESVEGFDVENAQQTFNLLQALTGKAERPLSESDERALALLRNLTGRSEP